MVRVPSRVAAVAVVVLLLGSAVSGIALAAENGNGNETVEKERVDDSSYSLDELQRGGYIVPEMHDGWRPIEGEPAAAWMTYYPTGPGVDDSRGSSDWKYLGSGETVQRNYVVLTVMRLGDVETREATFTVVYWDKATRTEKVGNSTRTEAYAANQTVEKVKVTLSGQATKVRIPLRAHYDTSKEVTVWMESSESSARWRFTHHSLKSTQSSAVDTTGELAVAIGKVVVYGAVLVLVAGVLSRLLARKGIVGPMKGLLWWTLVLGGVQLVGVLIAWDTVINTVSMHPELLALELGLVGFVQGIESRGREMTMDAIAIRPDIEPAKTATGNEGVSANGLGFDDVRVVTDEDGRHVLVEPGVVRWLIRVMGGRQYLEGTEPIRCEVQVTDGRPEIAYYVDPLSDEVIERESPSLGLRLPEPSLLQLAAFGGATYLVGVLAEVSGLGWQAGLAGVATVTLPFFLDVDAPNAVIEPAPAQMGEAHANSMVLAAEYDAVRTVEEAQDQLVAEQAKRNVAVERADEERATTLVEETLGSSDDSGDVRDIVNIGEGGDIGDLVRRLSERGDDSTENEGVPSDD